MEQEKINEELRSKIKVLENVNVCLLALLEMRNLQVIPEIKNAISVQAENPKLSESDRKAFSDILQKFDIIEKK